MVEMLTIQVAKEIDARGSFCPGPLLELIRGVKSIQVGERLAVISSDPGSSKDIPAWVAKAGHEMVAVEPVDGATRFVMRKAR
jgi:TusA-related sulfurtransferase